MFCGLAWLVCVLFDCLFGCVFVSLDLRLLRWFVAFDYCLLACMLVARFMVFLLGWVFV